MNKDPLYTIDAHCHVCQAAYKARYNVGRRAKVCTPKSHKCRRGKDRNGRRIPCLEKCCKSQYRRGASASAMDSAIDPRKVLNEKEFAGVQRAAKKLGVTGLVAIGLAIRFLSATGCRLGEMILVRKRDFSWQPGDVSIVKVTTLKRAGRPIRSVHLLNKSPFVKELREWVKRMKPEDRVFPVARRSVQRELEKIFDKVKKDRESLAHIFRHTRASQLIAAGADLNYVRQQLGWTSLEMAKIYTHVLDHGKIARVLGGV